MKRINFKNLSRSAFISAIFLVLVLVFCNQVFAAYTPDEICPKEEVSCMLKTSASLLSKSISVSVNKTLASVSSTSNDIAYGWSTFTNILLDNSINSLSTHKQFADNLSNNLTRGTLAYTNGIIDLNDHITSTLLTTKDLGLSTTASVGDSLMGASDGISDGWTSFTNSIIDNTKQSLTNTKDLAISLWNNIISLPETIRNGTETFIAILNEPVQPTLPVSLPPSLVTTAITPKAVEQPTLPTSTPTKVVTSPIRSITQNITQQQRDIYINQYDPSILPRIQGIELALQNTINHNSNQTDRVYDSIIKSINSSSNNITEEGTLNDTTLTTPSISNGTLSGTTTIGLLATPGSLIVNDPTTLNNNITLANNKYLGWKNAANTGETVFIKSTTADDLQFSTNGVSMTILSGGNTGIGAANPRTKLELGGDGSFLATGNFGSGWTEPNLGSGTRMFWYPKKAAFRAGSVDSTQWNDTNIGSYSSATNRNTTAKGDNSNATNDNTTADSYDSTAIGRWNVGGGNPTSWISTDPLFEVGNGTSSSNKANALTIYKNGNMQVQGTITGNLIGNVTGNLTGNADTVTNGIYTNQSYSNPTWLTAVPYSILSGTVPTWNQNTTGTAAKATILETARTIAGVSFDGSSNISIASTNLSDTTNIARLDAANAFSNAGVTSFVGSVGIGTISPSTKLHIKDSTSALIRLQTAGTGEGGIEWTDTSDSVLGSIKQSSNTGDITTYIGTSPKMTVQYATGNVGIGTITPTGKLHIAGNDFSGSLIRQQRASEDGSPVTFQMLKSRGTIASPSDVLNGDTLSLIQGGGYTNGNFKYGAGIRFYVDGVPSAGYVPGKITFETGTDIAAPSIRMAISSNGNVGIGTTEPSEKLGVNGNIALVGNDANPGFSNYIKLYGYSDPAGQPNRWAGIGEYNNGGSNVNELAFFTGVGDDVRTEKMRINNLGNVGIGTTTPLTQLDLYKVGNSASGLVVSSGHTGGNSGRVFFTNTTEIANSFAIYKSGLANASSLLFNYNAQPENTSGVTAMAILSGGNVGIGTTDPEFKFQAVSDAAAVVGEFKNTSTSGYGLRITTYSTGSQYAFAVDSYGGGYSRDFVIKNDGSVGIGTETPSEKLHVAGNILSSNLAGTGNRCVYVTAAGVLSAKGFDCGSASGGDNLGDHVATQNIQLGNYWLSGDGGSEGVFVSSTGNVGVGTNAPGTNFHIYENNTDVVSALRVENAGTGDASINFLLTGVAGYSMGIDNSDGDKFKISTSTAGVDTGTKFTLQDDGNIGIGTTEPSTDQLVIKSAIAGAGRQLGIDSLASGYSQINFLDNGTTKWRFRKDSSNEFDIYSDTLGAPVLHAKENGNVGIGTTNPVSKLDVNGAINIADGNNLTWGGAYAANIPTIWGVSGASGYLNFAPSGSTNGVAMTMLNNGKVGIGTTTPTGQLSLSNQISNGTDPSNYAATNGVPGQAIFNSYYASNTDGVGPWARYLDIVSVGQPAGTNGGSNIRFLTNPITLDSPAVERMRISSTGNVGIGTTAPSSALEVSKAHAYGAGVTDILTLTNAPTGNNPDSIGLAFRHNDTGNNKNWYPARIVADKSYDGTNFSGSLLFQTKTSDTSQTNLPTTKMTILENGNVGIGTTGPSSKLHVVGMASAFPAISGTTPTGLISRLQSNDSNAILDIGLNSASGAWLQTTNSTSLDANYPLLLNPNGGNVGIGTTAPVALGLTYTTLDIRGSDGGGVRFGKTASTNGVLYADVDNVSLSTTSAIPLILATNNTEWVRVLSNGNVGIGTTTPGTKLEISGNGATIRLREAGYGYYDIISSYSNSNPDLIFRANGDTETMRLSASGTVGIGTTTPRGILDIVGNSSGDDVILDVGAAKDVGLVWMSSSTQHAKIYADGNSDLKLYGGTTLGMVVQGNGNVGIGTTAPAQKLDVTGTLNSIPLRIAAVGMLNGGDTVSLEFYDTNNRTQDAKIGISLVGGYGSDLVFSTKTADSLIDGFATEKMRISSAGSIKFNIYGAGTLSTDSSGNITASSDERLKNIQGDFKTGLQAILALNPILYQWNSTSGMEMNSTYAGFSAQNVQTVIPEAVDMDPRGYLSLQDRPIMAATVNAIKELNLKVEDLSSLDTTKENSLGSLIKNFLANVENGIGDIFVKQVNTDKLCVSDSTGAKTCIDKAQLDSLMANASGSLGGNSSSGNGDDNDITCDAPNTVIDGICTAPADNTNTCDAPSTIIEGVCTAPTGGTDVTPSDLSALTAAKATAQGLIDANATESETPGDHIVGSLATLTTANEAATGTISDSQSTIDSQVTTLNDAITAYNSSIVPEP